MFLSQIIFHSDFRLDLVHPALRALAAKVSASTSDALKQAFKYETTAILMGHDETQTRLVPPIFSIERRSNLPFGENVYFSSAPLSTSEHLEMLDEVELAFSNP